MKMKLTTLLFGLLLAVGWTSSASAQALPQSNIAKRFTYKPMAVTPVIAKEGMRDDAQEPCGATYSASSIKDLKYTWTDASNVTHESPYVVLNDEGKYEAELVTDPYQMYGLLRGVYMEKKLPGPYYSAYKSDGTTREREVYYGGIDAGWDIPGETDATYDPLGNITITVSHDYSRTWDWGWVYTYYPVLIKSIKVMSGGTEVTKFDSESSAPNGWTVNGSLGWTTDGEFVFVEGFDDEGYATGIASSGTFTIASSVLTGYHDVQVVIEAYSEEQYYTGTIAVNNSSQTIAYGTTPTTYSPSAWAMQATSSGGTPTPGDILITVPNSGSIIASITLTSGNTTIQSWTAPTNGTYADLPTGWYSQKRMRRSTATGGGAIFSDETVTWEDGTEHTVAGGTIRIPAKVMEGYKNVTVTVRARRASNASNQSYVMINYGFQSTTFGQDGLFQLTTSNQNYSMSYTFPVNYLASTYKPEREGYTALMVAIKNNNTIFEEPSALNGSWEFSTRQEIVNYLRDNVESIKLLTDGLRIGNAEDYSRGTVFNCDATVNKFFILGKGQARQKADGLLGTIATGRWPHYTGEEVPFDFMYEEFSPTTGERGDQIEDFYSEMMKGNVYNVVHDCASVIQQGHQFSLSGNSTNPEPFSFTGLNFFIPDYRLKYWNIPNFYPKDADGNPTSGPWSVDGRDMNPYILADANDKTGAPYRQAQYFDMWFGQYNQDYAPQIGIYRITLDANAEKSADYNFDDPTKRNYDITLHWVSSLDEMAGHPVDQIYTLYTWDENGNRIELHPTGVKFFDAEGNELTALDGYNSSNPFVVTQVTYSWPQQATSQIFEYQVHGTPDDNEHPGFVAWSNIDYVVIPGWNDFLALKRNHYESDFVVNEEKNYYRNFMTVTNENEDNALTLERIKNGEDTYTLYRYDVANPNNMNPVADVIFDIQGNPENAKYVQFELSYSNYNSQDQLRPSDQPNKYDLTSMGVKVQGDLVIHGNGDLVIEPNGTTVNFHSIVVKSGNTVVTSWDGSGNLPSNWKTSPGAVWSTFEGKYYLEGQGYIYIPSTVLGNYQNITVTINASGDPGSVSRITVNDKMKKIANGVTDDYTWTAEEVAYDITSEDGMIRMGGLPIVDQFSASTAKNDHPERYGYVLIYKKGTDDEKQSSKVEVPVQHTKSKVNGFYTEDEVKNDTDRELTTNVLTADVTLNLDATNSDIYHYILLSDAKNAVPEIDDARTDYVSYLQQRTDFTYREMNENSPLWVEDNNFGWPAGEREYFNETEKMTGSYGDYKTYVPVVETRGFDRRWYEVEDSQYGDHLHNTYGSPIWKTSAGKVEGVTAAVQPQQGWNTTWTDNGSCRLYMLDKVVAKGYLPKDGVTNIEYEPYMFRIFVESPNGNLRPYTYKTVDGNKVITAGEGSTTGPLCVWSEYLKLDENGNILDNEPNGVTFKTGTDTNEETGETTGAYIEFHKNQVDGYDAEGVWNAEEMNAIFGALTSIETGENQAISKNDLKIYVRFYFKSTGGAIHSLLLTLRGDGDEEVPAYNAAEGEADTYQGPTAVEEIRYHGEVVSKTYYNAQGMQSDKPFDGVNIVVTRYSDGATSISKVVR